VTLNGKCAFMNYDIWIDEHEPLSYDWYGWLA
jgi:hypothetical protein